MTFREVCKKQVVQTMDGTILGRVDDLVLDDTGRQIRAFILYGAPPAVWNSGQGTGFEHPCRESKDVWRGCSFGGNGRNHTAANAKEELENLVHRVIRSGEGIFFRKS